MPSGTDKGGNMRKLASFKKKYGPVEGPKMFSRLQREVALASAHARHKKAIKKNPAAMELGAKGGTARANNLSKEALFENWQGRRGEALDEEAQQERGKLKWHN
jgi:hypothetical protein